MWGWVCAGAPFLPSMWTPLQYVANQNQLRHTQYKANTSIQVQSSTSFSHINLAI